MRDLTEAGRVMSDDLTGAFIRMTGAGGRFEGMVAKQAGTLKGLWTTTQDSIDKLKIGLGQILIDELGLKQVSRDLANFADNVGGGLDKLRPGVHLIGDLAKGGAQVTYEFGKAALKIAELNIEGLTQAFPAFANSLRGVREFIASIQDMKLDPKAITQLSLKVFEEVGSAFAGFIDWAEKTGGRYADDFRKNFVDPIREMIVELKAGMNNLDALGQAASKTWKDITNKSRDTMHWHEFTVGDVKDYQYNATHRGGESPPMNSMLSNTRIRESLKTGGCLSLKISAATMRWKDVFPNR